MINKKLSVIVPVFGVEKYLDKCVSSIVNQNYTNLEIILVDDGSPDECPQICDQWARRDSRIKVIHKKNGGLSSARNSGMVVATGEYLAFVDSDDFIDERMYEIMLIAMNETNADIAACGRIIYDGINNQPQHVTNQMKVFSVKNAFYELLTNGAIEEAVWDKVYKRSLFDGISFPDGEINEDLVVTPQIFFKAKSIVHVAEPFYYYRVNLNSISKTNYDERKRVVVKHVRDFKDLIIAHYPDLMDELGLFLARYSFAMLVCMSKDPLAIKTYKTDFEFYKKNLKTNLLKYYNAKNVTIKNKVEAILLCLNLYQKALKIKKIAYRLMRY